MKKQIEKNKKNYNKHMETPNSRPNRQKISNVALDV